MDSSALIIFFITVVGFSGFAIGLFAGLWALWTGVHNEIAGMRAEMQAMSERVSETELAKARLEGELRILARLAHGHESAALKGDESKSSDGGEDDKDG